jgi:hypothetical protein
MREIGRIALQKPNGIRCCCPGLEASMKRRKSEEQAKKRQEKLVLSIKTGKMTSVKSRLESEKRAVSSKSCVEPVTPMPKTKGKEEIGENRLL